MTGWIERVLLRLLPSAFRDRFGNDLRDEWQRLRQQARIRRGRPAEWAYVIREYGSFVRLVCDLRAREVGHAPDTSILSHVWPDVRGAWRQTIRRPAVTMAMTMTLTLSLAAAAVAFGVARDVLWRKLPFSDESRLVLIWEHASGPMRVTGSRFINWRARSSSFTSMSAFGAAMFHVESPDGINNVGGVRASWNFLDTLGVVPMLGRGFNAGDQVDGAPRVVLLSHAYWRQRMGAREDVIGQSLRMGGNPYTIIGVLPDIWMPAWPVNPATVTLDPESRQLWIPMAPESALAQNSGAHVMGVVARLREGRTIVQAEQELQSPAANDLDRHGAVVRPLRAQVTSLARGPLVTLLGAALCVWLVACLNLASLQLAAFESRRAEFTTRVALGAVPGRLVRQLWIESAWLVGMASAATLAVTHGAFVLLPTRLAAHVPFVTLPKVDANIVLFVAGLATVTVAAFTLWPMRRLRHMKGLAQPRTVVGSPRVFRTLVVAQLAGTVALVAVSALLLRSFWSLERRDAGFDASNVLALDMAVPTARSSQPESALAYETALRSELASTPWTVGAALAYDRPLEANWLENVTIVGAPQSRDQAEAAQSQLRIVSPTYFRTLGVEVVKGRAFEDHEGLGADGVVLVNEAFMRRTPLSLGRRLRVSAPRANWGDSAPEEFAIVGVVEDERFRGLEADVEPAVYISSRQFPLSHFVLLVRTPAGGRDFSSDLPAIVRRIDSAASLSAVTTLTRELADQQLTRTLTTNLVGGFAALSLLLASVGLHGLLTLIVTGRRREIGVRLALGATRQSVAGMVIRESVRPIVIGLGTGLLLAQLASDSVRALLVDVTATDPWSLIGVTAFMLTVGFAAAAIPARQATRVDPAHTLRG
ncbi:MAG TPA: ABC transporter permease [Vicinamibacterales bacterium]|nr:ABC transporter permease [Vicinamibacterales bacterium]